MSLSDHITDAAGLAQSANPGVLIVDDELSARKVLATMLEQAAFPCRTTSSGEEALRFLEKEQVEAVISDLRMPGISGMELLERVRQRFPHLAFLMATGVNDVHVGVQAMQKGADDYLVKPFQIDLVVTSLQRALRKKCLEREVENYHRHLEEIVAERTQQLQTALQRIESSYEETLEALGAAIDLRDNQTGGHSRRVSLYSVKIGKAMGCSEPQLRSIARGACLHDIGKLGIPDRILLKPGPLTKEERKIMQLHVRIGYDLVKRIDFLADAAEIILTHHEQCDGKGYPQGLKAEQIPLAARIFSVADAFDAMTSDRPYRSALPVPAAREEIEHLSGSQFDSQVVGIFLEIPVEFWIAIRKETATTPVSSIDPAKFLAGRHVYI